MWRKARTRFRGGLHPGIDGAMPSNHPSSLIPHPFPLHALTGTDAVRSNFPHVTHAPLSARRIARQITQLSSGR